MMTGRPDDLTPDVLGAHGIDALLAKPFRFAQLASTLATVFVPCAAAA